MKAYIKFDAKDVQLDGSNLIEASAGTGKTYSIAILVLRLILEKHLSIKDILMVTFTKAAVAELEERIRLFVRSAYKVSVGEEVSDPAIARLVNDAMVNSTQAEIVRSELRQALLLLDETSVMTIHSFCQQALTEFAFETRQVFGAETIDDTSAIIAEEINKFWRKEITCLPVELLTILRNAGLTQKAVTCVVKEHINGKKYFGYDPLKHYSNCTEDHDAWIKELNELRNTDNELRECLIRQVGENLDQMRTDAQQNTNGRKHLLPLMKDAETTLKLLRSKRDSQYVIKLFPDVIEELSKCDAQEDELKRAIKKIIDHLYCIAITQVSEGIKKHKLQNNVLSFDDMIVNLHQSLVVRDNPALIRGMRKKYKAVFVDEFQDTDRLQYEIFQKAFGTETILFYIGDPKQSIYAWRKADIFTYFKARTDVNNLYSMNHNYRSSILMIEAMNRFFSFDDAFYFEESGDSIKYMNVETPSPNTKGDLQLDGENVSPINLTFHGNKADILEAVTDQVVELFSSGYTIKKQGVERKIRPSDIGILVRSNKEAQNIKHALARYSIPAVTIGDERILRSAEATQLLYLLQAMEEVSPENINRALLSSFTGFDVDDILMLDEEQVIEVFKRYKLRWDEDGIYTAMMEFVADFNVRKVLLQTNTENGERIITNLFQLIELVHKVQTHKVLSPLELISWLKRGIDGMDTEGDEYEQRVESDEDSIKIVTIHKSKGLEYNIVFAPFLDLLTEQKNVTICSYRDPETGEYISGEKKSFSPQQLEWVRVQNEQENRRLIYVAITRAVYKCFIYHNTYRKQTSLTPFINNLSGSDPLLINSLFPATVPPGYRYTVYSGTTGSNQLVASNFSLLENNWRRVSYSALSAKHDFVIKNRIGIFNDTYGEFVFRTLSMGVNTGNMLHFIFENLHFADQTKWGYVIDQAVKKYAPLQQEQYTAMLHMLIDHVLNVEIHVGEETVLLSRLSNEQRIHEFEFDFTLPEFNVVDLLQLSAIGTMVSVRPFPELQGIMNGKIDLFFEYGGKYYVLDWKSNFLGDSIRDYAEEGLKEAMNENNYHLQYLIYTVAIRKYLESRLGPAFDFNRDFGGVIYLFVRGVRKGMREGIFTATPSKEMIDRVNEILSGAEVV